MYSLNLTRIALELVEHNSAYQDIGTKFLEHFLQIAVAMTNMADEHLQGCHDLCGPVSGCDLRCMEQGAIHREAHCITGV